MLIVASINSLKRANTKWENKEDFLLVKDLIDVDINKEEFEKFLDILIDKYSTEKTKILNLECLSLLKESIQFSQEITESIEKAVLFKSR